MPIRIHHGGQEFENSELTPQQMLDRVRASGQPAVTHAPNHEEYLGLYRRVLENADSAIHITTSRDLTGTYAAAVRAAGELGGRVQVVDSRYASYALGAQALRAARWADQGADVMQIVSRLGELQSQMLFLFAVERLEFLRINGRIGPAAAFVGNLLGLNPLIELRSGQMMSAGRARGQKAVLRELSKYALEQQQTRQGPVEVTCVYTAGGDQGAALLRQELTYLHARDGGIHPLGAGITANAGPAYGLLMMPAE